MKTLNWIEKEGFLVLEDLKFTSYMKMIVFIEKVALLAEARNHHPDFYATYQKITFFLKTHDQKMITQKDYDLAKDIEQLYKSDSW